MGTGVEKDFFVEQDTDEAAPGSVPWQQKGLAQVGICDTSSSRTTGRDHFEPLTRGPHLGD